MAYRKFVPRDRVCADCGKAYVQGTTGDKMETDMEYELRSKIVATKRYKGHVIEFIDSKHGSPYAAVTRGGIYLTDGEWPADVVEYVQNKIDAYCSTGVIK